MKKKTDQQIKESMKPKKTKTKGWYVRQLDKYFSLYIRQKSADHFGMSRCYTCDRRLHFKDLQCGHYIPRAHMNTRWDESNCRPQCAQCNVFKKGNYTEYSIRLIRECGGKELERLNKLKNTIRKWSISELKSEIERYKVLDR